MRLSQAVKYGLLNALLAFFVGMHLTNNAIGDGYYVFMFWAPVATFLCGLWFWKLIINPKNINTGDIIVSGLLTGSVSHFLTFILVFLGQNLCYWTTGGCTGSAGSPPAGIISWIPSSLFFTFFSLYMYGWITIPISILNGFIVKNWVNNSA